ncbi:phosphoethanolamine transferase [Marinobacter guineae]|uniref:Phosphoethanolamine transferase n=1 Tax=Marinobacter guineae TaxID=432303 RepID=A0A2G1VBE8_9GAMM|nr:phosphoethanolamine--lipid A transferase [Marinobacter guineae]PHQ24002.1 phosphoethanolamine transferase [Marinobacter guineae]
MKRFWQNLTVMNKSTLIVLVSIFLMAFGNRAFFSNITEAYPLTLDNAAFVISLAVVFGAALIVILSLVCYRHTTKPVLITILMLSSFAAYFMDSYNTVIDTDMLRNVAQTNVSEASDLMSGRLAMYVILLGILPSLFVYRVQLTTGTVRRDILSTVKLASISLGVGVLIVVVFSNFYASFIREHKILRYYANPSFYLVSTFKFASNAIESSSLPFTMIAADAQAAPVKRPRELIIMVVGETTRADRFSLNGYERETNPELAKDNVISFSDFWSCGTSTASSVPCMFSVYGQSDFDQKKAGSTENALDILARTGVNVLWLDNNSDSKGVADRVTYRDFKTPENNPDCNDGECRDTGMLADLQQYIDAHPKGDILIVLHQMGNHGPAYYKRYPKAFEKYTPVCQTNQLEDCSKEAINNAYDNATLYTDFFLSKVIDELRRNTAEFETGMFYLSDHGESLGEFDVYLHGLPMFIAPEAQRHVPAIMWFSDNFSGVNEEALRASKDRTMSQDWVFHTLLGLFDVRADVYKPNLDILNVPGAAKQDL